MKVEPLPSRLDAFVFNSKVQVLRLRRSWRNLLVVVPRCVTSLPSDFPLLLAENRTPLYSEADPRERRLQLGKVHNLRLVAACFDKVIIPKLGTLSFWRQVGRPSHSRGYVEGRQIQEGCVIPATAGGICQLSNALYDVALKAGLEVVERHPHTRALARGAWSHGRDATVAWNHIDLRWKASNATMVRVELTRDELVVKLFGKTPANRVGLSVLQQPQATANSCETCGKTSCHQHQAINHSIVNEKTAALVDQVWPEYVPIVNECDSVFMPIDGAKIGLARYSWTLDSQVKKHEARLIALKRSWASRRLAEQGATRQKSNLEFDKQLAEYYASRIPYDTTHLIVQQNLLPFLWRSGALGGRTFDVLMVRQPLVTLQKTLDAELEKHPDRKLLGDFRADQDLLQDEAEALGAARKIITPHSAIAAQFGDRAEKIDWCLPVARGYKRGERIAFPGSTIARKGAFELRYAAQRLGLKVVAVGSELEGGGFWQAVDVTKPKENWLDGCRAVVQPAILEDQPRKLLRAIAEGIPVFATDACGLAGVEGVINIPGSVVKALEEFARSPYFYQASSSEEKSAVPS